MSTSDSPTESPYPEAFAFLGNLLLTPLNHLGENIFDPRLWLVFERFDDHAIEEAASHCRAHLASAAKSNEATRGISVEYAKLFLGPPQPEAAPWQTLYSGGGRIGYGDPAMGMQRILRRHGLELSGRRNQYPDHIGIEMLVLSELLAQGDEKPSRILEYVEAYPGSWIGALACDAEQAAPGGFYPGILRLAESMIQSIRRSLSIQPA